MAHRPVVVSFDSLQENDLPVLAAMPNFARILPKAAVVRRVRPIYPTLTYPIHTTLITGVPPKQHGILHNQIPGLERENPDWSLYGSDWYWYADAVQVPTLPQQAQQAGRKAASVLWPVTAGQVEYLSVPPIWPDKRQDPQQLLRQAMTPEAFDRFWARYHSHYKWHNVDDMHFYGVEIALEVLEQDKPDLLLHHVEHLDSTRHRYGDSGREVYDCLRQLDIILGRYLAAAERAGILEQTNFVFLGDHGQIDVENVFQLNRLFVEEGLIQADDAGQPVDWLAYSFSAGFSSQVFLKDPADAALYARVQDFLARMQQRYPSYIERIYDREELDAMGIGGDGLAFMVEGTRGTMFDKKLTGPLVVDARQPGYRWLRASHGHHPDKHPQPPLIAFRPDIQPGVRVEQADQLSVYPTLAALLELTANPGSAQPLPLLKKE